MKRLVSTICVRKVDTLIENFIWVLLKKDADKVYQKSFFIRILYAVAAFDLRDVGQRMGSCDSCLIN